MPPPPPSSALLSRPHLAYLHASLGLTPPIRPDARAPTSFRALGAETDLLAGAHGSARVCFADGTEAVVGVRAEVERAGSGGSDEEGGGREWVEVGVEMQGTGVGSEDEGGLVFLEQMLREGLVADGHLSARLALGKSWHWRLFVDVRVSFIYLFWEGGGFFFCLEKGVLVYWHIFLFNLCWGKKMKTQTHTANQAIHINLPFF